MSDPDRLIELAHRASRPFRRRRALESLLVAASGGCWAAALIVLSGDLELLLPAILGAMVLVGLFCHASLPHGPSEQWRFVDRELQAGGALVAVLESSCRADPRSEIPRVAAREWCGELGRSVASGRFVQSPSPRRPFVVFLSASVLGLCTVAWFGWHGPLPPLVPPTMAEQHGSDVPSTRRGESNPEAGREARTPGGASKRLEGEGQEAARNASAESSQERLGVGDRPPEPRGGTTPSGRESGGGSGGDDRGDRGAATGGQRFTNEPAADSLSPTFPSTSPQIYESLPERYRRVLRRYYSSPSSTGT